MGSDQPDVAAHRRARRREAERRRAARRRAGFFGLLAAAAATAAVLAALAGGGSRHPAKPVASQHAHSGAAVASTARTSGSRRGAGRVPSQVRRASASPIGPVNPAGRLPQTHAFPSARSTQFKAVTASLWAGLVGNSVDLALPAFFPKQAYVQLKAIPSAESDWSDRLVRDYRLDIAAAHALLGADPTSAQLVAVTVESSYGHWVPPGVCDNGVGYYEMPGSRVVYRERGALRSFGIASMISWRGVWYVVHLGAVLRSGESGVVDEPSSGPGTPAYSGTC